MVGVWILSTWIQLGKPTPCTLVELGPGRGTLMFDALRVQHQHSITILLHLFRLGIGISIVVQLIHSLYFGIG